MDGIMLQYSEDRQTTNGYILVIPLSLSPPLSQSVRRFIYSTTRILTMLVPFARTAPKEEYSPL